MSNMLSGSWHLHHSAGSKRWHGWQKLHGSGTSGRLHQ